LETDFILNHTLIDSLCVKVVPLNARFAFFSETLLYESSLNKFFCALLSKAEKENHLNKENFSEKKQNIKK
jgi:hypothetical protein